MNVIESFRVVSPWKNFEFFSLFRKKKSENHPAAEEHSAPQPSDEANPITQVRCKIIHFLMIFKMLGSHLFIFLKGPTTAMGYRNLVRSNRIATQRANTLEVFRVEEKNSLIYNWRHIFSYQEPHPNPEGGNTEKERITYIRNISEKINWHLHI